MKVEIQYWVVTMNVDIEYGVVFMNYEIRFGVVSMKLTLSFIFDMEDNFYCYMYMFLIMSQST